MGTHELLAPFRPLLKFILVKSVIFLTFWQGLFIAIAVGTGAISSPQNGNNTQNFLICIEMLPAAICIMFAFPWRDFADGVGQGLAPDAVTHAMSLRDVVTDTLHQFAPTYQNYVLYSDGTAKRATGQRGDDGDLLSSVEMAGASGWNDDFDNDSSRRGGEPLMDDSPPEVGRSKYLASEADPYNESGRTSSAGGHRRAPSQASDAEARWQSINIPPAE